MDTPCISRDRMGLKRLIYKGFLAYRRGITCRQHGAEYRRYLTVNRMVAGSNPARGAKPIHILGEFAWRICLASYLANSQRAPKNAFLMPGHARAGLYQPYRAMP